MRCSNHPRRTFLRNQLVVAASAVALAHLTIQSASAETGITNVVNGVFSKVSGNYMIGTNGAFNTLIITNAGSLITGGGTIGNSSVSSNNQAWVIGPGSLWSNSGTFYLGNTGSFNQLIISDGAQMTNTSWFFVGNTSSFNQLTISGGAKLFHGNSAYIGHATEASNNIAIITDLGSVWSIQATISIGRDGPNNSMIITNGGQVIDGYGYIGVVSGAARNNSVIVTGAGSLWMNTNDVHVGQRTAGNSLMITNGGQVIDGIGFIGTQSGVSNNSAIVTGSGSLWSNSLALNVGCTGWNSRLTVTENGTVLAPVVYVGTLSTSSNNLITISGGSLYATNTGGTGALDVRNGKLSLNTGTVVVNQLYLTNNASSVMTFSAGLLRSGGSTVSNGVAFTVGDGTSAATLDLLGGTHSFADGLMLSTNSSLIGNGSITAGSATNFGTIAPGHSAGTLSFSGDLTLQDSSVLGMELGGTNSGAYDQVFVGGILRIGGLLNVTLINGYTGNIGDTFDLFSFSSKTGTFSQTNLPTLSPGLEWNTSKLYTLGDIQIVPEPGVSALLALGLAALGARRRVKNSK